MRLLVLIIIISTVSIIKAQYWYKVDNSLIIDLVNLPTGEIITLEQPENLIQANQFIVKKYDSYLNAYDSVLISKSHNLRTQIESIDITPNNTLVITGLALDDKNLITYISVLVLDDKLSEINNFLYEIKRGELYYVINTSHIANKFIVASSGRDNLTSLLIFDETGNKLNFFEEEGVTAKYYSINDSIILGEIPRGFYQINLNTGYKERIKYETAQRYVYSSGSGIIPIDEKSFIFFTVMGLLKGIHPDYDKLNPSSDGGQPDPYSGVLYKLSNTYPYSILKHLRIGDTREEPAYLTNIDYTDLNSIYLGINNYTILSDMNKYFRKYIRLTNVTEELELNWDLIIYPQEIYKFIYINGIKALPDGSCLVFGVQYEELYGSTKNSFIFKIGKDGEILPYGNSTKTNEKNFDLLSIKIYPNPADEVFNIEINDSNDDFLFELFDQTGKLLMIKKALKNGHNQININVLIAGTYFYRLSGKDSIYKTGNIIKE